MYIVPESQGCQLANTSGRRVLRLATRVESRTGAGALDAWDVVVPFPVPAHRSGLADFPHPALRPACSLKLSREAVPGVSGAGLPRPTCQTPAGR